MLAASPPSVGLGPRQAALTTQRRARHLIECAPPIVPTGDLLANATPLLEEESCPRIATCRLDLTDPFLGHRPRTRPTFAADDCPVDARQVSGSHRAQQ